MVAVVLFAAGAASVAAALGALYGWPWGLLVAGAFCLGAAWDLTRTPRDPSVPAVRRLPGRGQPARADAA
jgi:hypothetical protein